MAPHSSTLAWKIPWMEEPGRLQSMGSLRVRHNWVTSLSLFTFLTEWLHFHFSLSCVGEGNGNPLQYSCLENPRDGGAWWAAIYGVVKSWTRLKWLSSSSFFTSFLQAGGQRMDAMAMSPECVKLLLHIVLLRGQRLEIEKKDIKQQDFEVLTPQSLPAIWPSQCPRAHPCVHALAYLFHGTSLFQFLFCWCILTETAVVYKFSYLINLLKKRLRTINKPMGFVVVVVLKNWV